jgi:RNA polymerase sigma-70 factor (ECF subfamily)
MTSVQNFLHNERDRSQAIKRGGGCKPLSLDQLDPEVRYRLEPVTETDPAKAFEQRWAATLLETVLNRLREEFSAEGRGPLFEKLQAHL